MKLRAKTLAIWLAMAIPAFSVTGWILGDRMLAAKTVSGPGLIQTNAEIGGPIQLVGSTGEPVTEAAFSGRPVILYFGFTYCPDICPTSLQTVAEALDALGPDGAKVQPVFITVDPKRDTPEIVGDYAGAFHDDMVGLTGTEEQIAAVARAFRVLYIVRDRGRGDDYLVDHSSYYYLMDEDWKLAAVMQHDITPDDMAAAIRQLL